MVISNAGVRPTINLKSSVSLVGGTGTKEDPYLIKGDLEKPSVTALLNTRISGEYVTFNNELYRIVGIENGITKLNKNDYLRDIDDKILHKKFSDKITYGTGNSNDYWDYYLNNTWYNSLDTTSKNMLVEGTYYLGTVSSDDKNYKLAVCKNGQNTTTYKCEKTDNSWKGYVGLPRYGEMFASQQDTIGEYMWLMTPYSDSTVWSICYDNMYAFGYDHDYYNFAARPSINLKSTIKITGGNGTSSFPFTLSE